MDKHHLTLSDSQWVNYLVEAMCYFISKDRKDTVSCQMFSPESRRQTMTDFRVIFFYVIKQCRKWSNSIIIIILSLKEKESNMIVAV